MIWGHTRSIRSSEWSGLVSSEVGPMLRPVLFSFLSLVRYNSQLVQIRLSMARGYEWSAAVFSWRKLQAWMLKVSGASTVISQRGGKQQFPQRADRLPNWRTQLTLDFKWIGVWSCLKLLSRHNMISSASIPTIWGGSRGVSSNG